MGKFDMGVPPPPEKGARLLAHGLCGNRGAEILSTNNGMDVHFDGQKSPFCRRVAAKELKEEAMVFKSETLALLSGLSGDGEEEPVWPDSVRNRWRLQRYGADTLSRASSVSWEQWEG